MSRPRASGSSDRPQRTSARTVEFVPSSPTGSSVSDGDPPGYIPPFELVASGGYRPSSETPSTSVSDSAANANKRNYEELEEITFANPKSFHSMAFAIAATRGMTLVIADDRTHKVTSAYMHICCSFRRSGCPFILKLTKAKEGGWVMKSPKATDVDPKQRSQYRCRHMPGAEPESLVTSGSPVGRPNGIPLGGVTLPAIPVPKPTKKKPQVDSPIIRRAPVLSGKDMKPILPPVARDSRPAKLRTSNNSAHGSPGSPSKLVPHKVEDAPRVVYLNAEPGDRALAPPFERSQSLASQITPVLGMDRRESGSPSIAGAGGYYKSSRLSAPPLAYRPTPNMPAPIVTSLPEWTAFLTLLDPELIPYASILANPSIDVSPESFFKEDEEMRTMLLDSLEMAAWPKLKLKSKIKARGAEVWNMLLEDKGKGTSRGGSSNGESSVKMKREEGEGETKILLPTTTVGNSPLPPLIRPSRSSQAVSSSRASPNSSNSSLPITLHRAPGFPSATQSPLSTTATTPTTMTPRRELRLATGQQAATLANAVAGAHFNSHGQLTEIAIPVPGSYTGLPVEDMMSEEEEEGDEGSLVITPIVTVPEQTFAMPKASPSSSTATKPTSALPPVESSSTTASLSLKRKEPPAGEVGEGPVAKMVKPVAKTIPTTSTPGVYWNPANNGMGGIPGISEVGRGVGVKEKEKQKGKEKESNGK